MFKAFYHVIPMISFMNEFSCSVEEEVFNFCPALHKITPEKIEQKPAESEKDGCFRSKN